MTRNRVLAPFTLERPYHRSAAPLRLAMPPAPVDARDRAGQAFGALRSREPDLPAGPHDLPSPPGLLRLLLRALGAFLLGASLPLLPVLVVLLILLA